MTAVPARPCETLRTTAAVHHGQHREQPTCPPQRLLFLLVADDMDTTTGTPDLQGTTWSNAQGMDGGKSATTPLTRATRSCRARYRAPSGSNSNQRSRAKENRHSRAGRSVRDTGCAKRNSHRKFDRSEAHPCVAHSAQPSAGTLHAGATVASGTPPWSRRRYASGRDKIDPDGSRFV